MSSKLSLIFIISFLSAFISIYGRGRCLEEQWKYLYNLRRLYHASLVLNVDTNGCGNFSSIQGAIQAIPESSISKTLIFINSGVYRLSIQLSASSSCSRSRSSNVLFIQTNMDNEKQITKLMIHIFAF